MRSKLHPHQERGFEQLREAMRDLKDAGEPKRVMLQAPTGSGKTILAAGIVESALSKGKRVTFTVPALELVDQTVERFFREGITDLGVIQAHHPMTRQDAPVQIASVQTLMKRERPPTDLWVVDEGHIWFEWYEKTFPVIAEPVIALSATPGTKGLGKYYGRLITPTTMRELQREINPETGQPYLVTENVLAPTHINLDGVKTIAGDFHPGQLAEKMNRPDLIGDVVRIWKERGEGRSTIMFGVDRAHALATQKAFEAAGVRAGYIDGLSDKQTRRSVRESFERSDIQIVCSVGCLTTGVDWDVRCIILARPTKSEMLFAQMIGRGLRPAEGKDDCLVLDHTDTYQRLGFAADITWDTLNDGSTPAARKIPEARLPFECKGRFEGGSCGRIKQPGEHTCKRCGFTPERQNKVTWADGELGAMTVAQKAERDARRDWFAQLLWVAADKKYKPGWASHKYMAKFKEWPPDAWKYTVEPEPAGQEVKGFLQHLSIKARYAKKPRSKQSTLELR